MNYEFQLLVEQNFCPLFELLHLRSLKYLFSLIIAISLCQLAQ